MKASVHPTPQGNTSWWIWGDYPRFPPPSPPLLCSGWCVCGVVVEGWSNDWCISILVGNYAHLKLKLLFNKKNSRTISTWAVVSKTRQKIKPKIVPDVLWRLQDFYKICNNRCSVYKVHLFRTHSKKILKMTSWDIWAKENFTVETPLFTVGFTSVNAPGILAVVYYSTFCLKNVVIALFSVLKSLPISLHTVGLMASYIPKINYTITEK